MLKIRLSICLVIASLLILSAPLMVHAPPPDNTPPSIGIPVTSPSSPSASDIVTILVNVTDNRSGVQNVTIAYTTDNWQSVNTTVTASYNATTTTATGQIPALSAGGHVEYYIVAIDNAGNKQVNNNSGAFYGYDIAASPLTSVTNAWLAIVAVAGVALGVCIVSLRMLRKKPLRTHQSN